MPYYECVFIARQDVSTPQAEGLADHFSKVIEGHGGTIPKKEYWGLRTLSYRIRKNRKGHYTLMNIEAPADAIAEMERQMRLNEDVIRHMTVRVESLAEGPSAIMQTRSARGDDRDRGRRFDRDRGRSDDRPDRRSHDDRPRHDRGNGGAASARRAPAAEGGAA
jgi:small subunit ribosomal protein S6